MVTRESRATVTFPEETMDSTKVAFATAEIRQDIQESLLVRKSEAEDNSSTGTYASKNSSKRYKLFFLPKECLLCYEICRKLVRQGTTFCTTTNCAVAHRSKDRLTIVLGEIYVSARVPNQAFVEPSVSAKLLEGKVIASWKGDLQTLQDWSQQF